MDKFHGLVVFVAARSLLGVFSVDGEDGRKTARDVRKWRGRQGSLEGRMCSGKRCKVRP